MPNGMEHEYVEGWCRERHVKLDKRMDSIENKFWGIIVLLITNLGGVTALLFTGSLP